MDRLIDNNNNNKKIISCSPTYHQKPFNLRITPKSQSHELKSFDFYDIVL